MSNHSNDVRRISRKQLDRRLDQIREMRTVLQPPTNGWIATLRNALGMTQGDLASRIGISRQAAGQLERRESDDSVTLKALKEAARALGAEVVYAIVPERPISATLEDRALRIARRMTASVKHTMRLEDQETDSDVDERTRELANELLSTPERLWSLPDDD